MADALKFKLGGVEYEAVPVKLERKKLYGYTDVVATDAQGGVCMTAQVDPDGELLIPPGAVKSVAKSTLLKRKVFKKESKGKVMLQKFVMWKTNKETDPRYPAFVFHYTDFSSGRKDPLKKDLRVAATEAQITSIFDSFVAENVKKGWNEVN